MLHTEAFVNDLFFKNTNVQRSLKRNYVVQMLLKLGIMIALTPELPLFILMNI